MRSFLMLALLSVAGVCSAQDKTVVVKVAPPPVAIPANAATPEQVREFFTLTHLDEAMKHLMSQMLSAMKSTAPPYIPPAFWQDMDQTMTGFDFLSELVPIYQQHLSRDDMGAVLAFYRSDPGRHLLDNQNAMTAEAQEKFRKIGQHLGEQVGERHSDEIVAAQKKYEQDIANKQNLNLTPDPK